MKELVEVIARALVDNPDEVVVTETEKEDTTVIELKVAPSDMGKVIGKQGRIAKAIRSVVKAAASKEEKKGTIHHDMIEDAEKGKDEDDQADRYENLVDIEFLAVVGH